MNKISTFEKKYLSYLPEHATISLVYLLNKMLLSNVFLYVKLLFSLFAQVYSL